MAVLVWSGLSLHAIAAPVIESVYESTVESYRFQHRIGAQVVTTTAHLFDESPLENPNLLNQIKTAGLDHVVFINNETEQNRGVSAIGDLDELHTAIERTGIPVVDVQPPKGFFQKVKAAWNLSFKNRERRVQTDDYRYGLINVTFDTGLYTVMVISSSTIGLESSIGLVAAVGLISYVDNVKTRSIQHFLASNWIKAGEKARDTTYFLRGIFYDYATSQIFKLIEDPSRFLNASTQATIALNTAMVGAGDVLTSNMIYKAFEDDPVKLRKVNSYLTMIGSVFGSLDLMQPSWMPVLASIGSYDFHVSGAILIGYYATAILSLKYFPNHVYKVVDRIDSALSYARKWLGRGMESCALALRPRGKSL